MRQNILFTCAGRRNYLINYFKEALNGQGMVLAADKSLSAPALVDADQAIQLPSIDDSDYISKLKEVILHYNVTAVISLNDLELPILAKNKTVLEEDTGAKVIISKESVIDMSFDKWKTHQFLVKNGFNSPKSYINLQNVLNDLSDGQLSFPLVVKPRWGSASLSINYAENPEELDLLYSLQQIQLKRTGNNINDGLIIQEKLDGDEYGLDVLNTFEGEYFGAFARKKLQMRSGETDKAMSVITAELSSIGENLGRLVGHIGNMDCDIFKCNEVYYVLELNPRFGGGYPFSHEAGINTAGIYIDWLNGNADVDKHNNYKANLTFSKCDRMMMIPTKK